MSFKDKVVIITGANNGIGAAAATLFASEGAKIAAIDIREPATPSSNANKLDIKCNVASESEVDAAVKQIVEKWGTIDVLCNVAGVMDRFERVHECSNEQLERTMAVNFNGPFYLMRAVIPHFLAKPGGSAQGESHHTVLPPLKGSIVNVCSYAAVSGAAAGPAYTASKHALLGLSRSTAWMYRREGIRCNVIIPGGVATNIMANSGNEKFDMPGYMTLKVVMDTMPAVAMPDDVGRAIVFLAGANAVNGAELTVDHGWNMI